MYRVRVTNQTPVSFWSEWMCFSRYPPTLEEAYESIVDSYPTFRAGDLCEKVGDDWVQLMSWGV